MTMRWSELSDAERALLEDRCYAAARVENVLSRAQSIQSLDPADRPVSLSLLYDYAVRQTAELSPQQRVSIAQNEMMSAALDQLLQEASIAYFPKLAAASSGESKIREQDGFEIKLEPSRAHADQVYLIITNRGNPDRVVRYLNITSEGRPPVFAELPEMRDGRAQMLLAADSEIVQAFRNASNIFLT